MTRAAKIWALGAAGLAVLAALGVAALDLGAWAAKSPASAVAEKPLSALFPRSEDYDFEPPAPGSYALPVLKTAPDGVVLNHTGAELRLSEAVSGKISLVSFVYLMCADGDGCPLALATLFDIYETSVESERLRDNVQLVSVSFDPERDTPDALESYAYPMLYAEDADQRIDWRMLTTRNRRALQPILRGYGQVINRAADGVTINHLLRMFLVDRDGKVRNVYGLGMIDPRLLMTDIETLLMEEAAQ